MSTREAEIRPSLERQRYYPWVVIAIAFLTVAVAFGTRNAFAVFLVAVIEEFHWSRALASGALMLGSVTWTISAPLIGIALDRFGPRIVLPVGALIMALGLVITGLGHSAIEYYVGIGALMGIGFAALTMTSQATFLSNWFVRKRGMAIGVAASGIGLGILVVVPWTQWLIATYGWRAALFFLAGVLAVIVAPVNFLFQRQRPEEMNLKPDFGQVTKILVHEVKAKTAEGPTLRQALRDWRFWSFAVGVLAGAIPLHMVLIHQVAAVSDAGFSKDAAAWALGLIGLFTAPAMIGMGLLADRIGHQRAYAFGSAVFMIGILCLMTLNGVSSRWLFYAFPPLIAIGFSSRQSLYPTIAADLFHGKSFGAIIGALALFIGGGAGIGPWLGGFIFDWTGGYYWAFCIAQLSSAASVVFVWLAGSRQTR